MNKSSHKTIKDLLFILCNLLAALISAYWAAKFIDLNFTDTDDNYIFSFFIGGFFGSVLTLTMRRLLKKRRCYNIYYMTIALLATAIVSASLSFILNALTLAA